LTAEGQDPMRNPNNAPPAGIWVNRKDAKSYVYDLMHGPNSL